MIDMNNIRYSLSVSYINKRNSNMQFFRVADLDLENLTFQQAEYTLKENDCSITFDPLIIGGKANLLSKAEIRKWESLDVDKSKSISYDYDKQPIEIIFSKNLFIGSIEDNKESIREVLFQGIEINHEIQNNFLLVVAIDGEQYIALECNLRYFTKNNEKFKMIKNCNDMLHTMHYLNIHHLKDYDILDTEKLDLHISLDERAKTRYFFKYLNLKPIEGKLLIRNISEYATAFVMRRLKEKKAIFQLSTSDIKKFNCALNDVTNEQNEMKQFISNTGIPQEMLLSAVTDLKCTYEKDFFQDSEFDCAIRQWLLSEELFYNSCLKEVRMQWLKEKNSEREKISEEIEDEKKSLEQKKCDVTKSTRDYAEVIDKTYQLGEQHKVLLEAVQELEFKKEKIENEIEEELNDFKGNMVHNIALTAFAETAITNGEIYRASNEDKSGVLVRNGTKVSDSEPISYEDIDEVIDDISDNCSICGVGSEYTYDLAKVMVATISCHTHLVLKGFAQEIANAISLVLESAECSKVYIPAGYNSIKQIVELINNIESKIIVIDGLLENLNESLCLALMKNCNDKLLIFTLESEDACNYISKYIWRYALYVDIEAIIECPTYEEMNMGKYRFDDIYKCFCEKNVLKNVKLIIDSTEKADSLKKCEIINVAKILSVQNIDISLNSNSIVRSQIEILKK